MTDVARHPAKPALGIVADLPVDVAHQNIEPLAIGVAVKVGYAGGLAGLFNQPVGDQLLGHDNSSAFLPA